MFEYLIDISRQKCVMSKNKQNIAKIQCYFAMILALLTPPHMIHNSPTVINFKFNFWAADL